jgi:hypothetical protein
LAPKGPLATWVLAALMLAAWVRTALVLAGAQPARRVRGGLALASRPVPVTLTLGRP